MRAWCRLADPQVYAHVPVFDDDVIEVREVHNKRCWPNADAPELALDVQQACLRLPVFNAIRRDFHWRAAVGTDEEACYLIADDMPFEDFRQRLIAVRISK